MDIPPAREAGLIDANEHSGNLDFVRALAVLMVVGRHLAYFLGYTHIGPVPLQFVGIFGVMLFFVLTANVLMFSLDRISSNESSAISLHKAFLIKRVFRIYPLSIFIVLTGFLGVETFGMPGFQELSVTDLFANVLLVQNITGAPDIIGPLWSLPLEVQMYLFLPAIFLFTSNQPPWRVVLVYAAFVALAVTSYLVPLPSVFKYAPWFMPGVLAYWIAKRQPKRSLPFAIIPLGLTILVWIYGILGQRSQTMGAIPICLIVGVTLPFVKECSLKTVGAVAKSIAKYSYGVYLIHMPVLTIGFMLNTHIAVQIAFSVAGTWILSVFAYRYIESPMISIGAYVAGTKRPDIHNSAST